MRLQLGGAEALAFGYVPPGNSARLLAVGVPLLLGRAPGDAEFQRVITSGAAKVFGSLGWSSKAYATGIEDRYLITLQPSIAARLKVNFQQTTAASKIERVLPEGFYSVTSYNSRILRKSCKACGLPFRPKSMRFRQLFSLHY